MTWLKNSNRAQNVSVTLIRKQPKRQNLLTTLSIIFSYLISFLFKEFLDEIVMIPFSSKQKDQIEQLKV